VGLIEDDEASIWNPFSAAGYFTSLLADHYLIYDRQLIIATLDDWGWFGHSTAPDWYSGIPWT